MTPKPELSLPAPLLCCDPGSFAENTLLVRLPDIARRVLGENSFPPEVGRRIDALLAEMSTGTLGPLSDPGAPDELLWQSYQPLYLGKRWAELPFLVCENLFYRRILQATGYFQPGLEFRLDPYLEQKRLGLSSSQEALQGLARRLSGWLRQADEAAALKELLESNLWSNRADLSLWPAGAEGTISNDQLHQAEEFLAANDLNALAAYTLSLKDGLVDLLIDNAGFELVEDLALADFLLERGIARQVRFHLKAHPTFVSDAMAVDVRSTAAFLADLSEPYASAFGQRLIGRLSSGTLILDENLFWNSPLLGWQVPEDVRADLARADLVISKGDANFRRLIGDLRWKETSRFNVVTAYFPTRLAALRVLKSEAILGLQPGKAPILDARDPAWRYDGKWGVILFR
jgi:hypothetical protein